MSESPTERELEVLLAVVRLGSGKAAAHELGISEHTVKATLTTLRFRLGASNTAQAFAIAAKRGLIEASSPKRARTKRQVAAHS